MKNNLESTPHLRLGILGSTRGTVMLALIEAIKQKRLKAEIVIVVSNKCNSLILERAKQASLPTRFIDPKNLTKENYDQKISETLKLHAVDFVVLIGYMRILSNHFVNEWRGKVINTHPSLLPAFAGLMNANVHQAVLDAQSKETGCTIHHVTEEVDGGAILLQKKCLVHPHDDVEKLKNRVQILEGEALIETINDITRVADMSSRGSTAGSSRPKLSSRGSTAGSRRPKLSSRGSTAGSTHGIKQ